MKPGKLAQLIALVGVAAPAAAQLAAQPQPPPMAASASYTGIKHLTLTAGIKNLSGRDPPFAITYDSNTGAGSSWEPRVADPRGRSLTLMANYKFL